MGEWGSDPVPLDAALRRMRQMMGTARPDTLAVLTSSWPELLGQRLADRYELRAIKAGKVVIVAADPAVAEQLRWSATDLVAAMNALLGVEEVTAVNVRVERVGRPGGGPGPEGRKW